MRLYAITVLMLCCSVHVYLVKRCVLLIQRKTYVELRHLRNNLTQYNYSRPVNFGRQHRRSSASTDSATGNITNAWPDTGYPLYQYQHTT